MREALVTQAMPQNSWPMVAMAITSSAVPDPSAVLKIASEEPSPKPFAGLLIAFVSVAANVIASSTNQPIRPDQKTERHTPLAAPSAAPLVSSDTCADAS